MGIYDNPKQNKPIYIHQWKQKGLDWCAEQLWNARHDRSVLHKELKNERFLSRGSRFADETLKQANSKLVTLLKKEGVKPQRLIVEFKDGSCGDNAIECWESSCDECPYFEEWTRVETFAFYSWDITGNMLRGITKALEDEQLEVVRIIDSDTGTTLFEAKEESDVK